MAATLVDTRPTEVTLRILKGAPVSTTFYYLDANNAVVDLTGYTASIKVYDSETGLEDTNLTRASLPLITGDVPVNGILVTGAYGVCFDYTALETQVPWSSAKFMCNLVASDNTEETLIYGTITTTSLL